MSFDAILSAATNKANFETLQGYVDFAARYINFIEHNLQARIVSRNEPHYQFLQYGHYA